MMRAKLWTVLILFILITASFSGCLTPSTQKAYIYVRERPFDEVIDDRYARVDFDYDIYWTGTSTIKCEGHAIYTGEEGTTLGGMWIAMIVHSADGDTLGYDSMDLEKTINSEKVPFSITVAIPEKQTVYVDILVGGGGLIVARHIDIVQSEYTLKYA